MKYIFNKLFGKFGSGNLMKVKLALLLALLPAALAFFVYSCQEVVEPNDPKPMIFTIISEDQSGSRVPGARVFLAPGLKDSLIYAGDTDFNGEFRIQLQIPCQGHTYKIKVEPPFNNPDYSGSGCLDTINLTCCDFTYVCSSINKTLVATTCTNVLKEFDVEKNICLDTTNTARAASTIVENQTPCDWNVRISSAIPPIPQGLTVEVNSTSSATPLNLPSNFTLPATGSFYLNCNLNTVSELNYHGAVNIIATCSSTGDTCFVGKVNLNFDAIYCDNCRCPKDSVISLKYIDTVCAAEIHEFNISLDSVYKYVNKTSECNYIFTLTNTFASNAIKISKFNGANPSSLTLYPGDDFESVTIEFTPPDTNRYLDTAEYSMSIINTFGQEIQCNVKFRVIFDVYASGPECYITPLSIPNIIQCVDVIDAGRSKYFIVENRGECPLGPVTFTLSGASAGLFSVTPSSMTIPPNSKDTVYVSFAPTKSDVWPNGYGTTAIDDFFATLQINSPSASCSIKNYNLHGIADTTCGSGYICMREFARNGNYEGVIINNQYDFTVSLNPDFSTFDLYASSINVTSSQATLNSGKGGLYKRIQSNYDFQGGNLCFEATQAIYDECDSGTPGSASISVAPRDLILLKYPSGECALIWIDTIFATSTNPQDYVICLYICTKI